MNIFLTHQYLLGPKIAMKALLFPMIFYTHRIFILFLFLQSPNHGLKEILLLLHESFSVLLVLVVSCDADRVSFI